MKENCKLKIQEKENEKIIYFPKAINHSFQSFEALTTFSKEIERADSKKMVTLDLGETRFFSADQCSSLGAIIYHNNSINPIGIRIKQNLSTNVKKAFHQNKFSKCFGIEESIKNKSAIFYTEFSPKVEEKFEEYLNKQIIKFIKVKTGKLVSDEKINKLKSAIRELYINVGEHTQSKKVYICGQYYHKKRQIYISLVNTGISIRELLEIKNPEEITKDTLVIEWAVKIGNTTKPKSESGGLGLAVTRNIMLELGGGLVIVSGKEYYEEYTKEEKKETRYLRHRFPGTAIILKINCSKDENNQVDKIEETEEIEEIKGVF